MSTLLMSPPPHRKPVPARAAPPPATSSYTRQPAKQPPSQLTQDRMHSRTRTNSSAVMPFANTDPPQPNLPSAYAMTTHQQQLQQQQQASHASQTRRTLSNATSSTSNSGHSNNLQRVHTNSNYSTISDVRRSTSSRSNSSVSPTSYVALMRKQKGTVWCDRAQHEDPRILAAQRQAKMRAAQEVAGGHNYATQVRTSTSGTGVVGGVRSKIRHHGAPKASAYNSAAAGRAGVPMRLSASEVDDGNESDEETGAKYHVRNGSGRSSLGSTGKRAHSYMGSGLAHSYSNGSTPPNRSPVDSMGNVIEEETPMQRTNSIQKDDYFAQPGGRGGSGSSGEQEEQFGTANHLPQARGQLTADEKAAKIKSADDLQRRGSVDDRTMTMSGVRLFVANPDEDSD